MYTDIDGGIPRCLRQDTPRDRGSPNPLRRLHTGDRSHLGDGYLSYRPHFESKGGRGRDGFRGSGRRKRGEEEEEEQKPERKRRVTGEGQEKNRRGRGRERGRGGGGTEEE